MDEVVLSMTISQLIGFSTDSSIFHEMKNGEDPKNLEFSPFFSVPDVIRTRGLPLRSDLKTVLVCATWIKFKSLEVRFETDFCQC